MPGIEFYGVPNGTKYNKAWNSIHLLYAISVKIEIVNRVSAERSLGLLVRTDVECVKDKSNGLEEPTNLMTRC
jgi:hypothetical protein